jgi:hypothetical protein
MCANFDFKEDKNIPVTGRGGPEVCEMSRLPYFLVKRLTVGGEMVSLTLLPTYNPRKISGIHFFQRLSLPHGYSAAGRIRSIKNSNDLIGNRSGYLPP